MRWSLPADRALGALLPVLALLAEGAWIAVAYVALQTTVDGQVPLLGTFEFAVVAGAAALAVRRGWLDPDEQPLTFAGALVGAGTLGWLWDAAPRELLADGRLADAVGLHPGGWLAIVAVMRGAGRGLEIDDRAVTRLVLVGLPSLAVPWLLGQFAPEALRGVFVREAFVASLTFVATGFMAAGLARLQAIGRETGVDWRRHRSWLVLVLGVLLLVLALGIPAAILLGVPVETVARGIVGPLLALIGYLLLAVALIATGVLTVVALILQAVGFMLPAPLTPGGLDGLPAVREYTFEELRGPLLSVAMFWAVLLLLAVVLLRTWLRRRGLQRARRPDEERSFQVPPLALRIDLPRPSIRPRVRGTPRDAIAAYLAALDDLARHGRGLLGRLDHETPRAHAARVVAAEPATNPQIARLQADYALARYAGRPLTQGEHRRAVRRWRRLRDRLRAVDGES